MLPIDLSGRVALVTGGSGELGRVLARTLARSGATVAVQYKNGADRARDVVTQITNLGGRAVAVPGDITDGNGVRTLQREVKLALGDPDIIIANAVIQYPWTTVLEQKPEDYEGQFRSSVLHVVHLAQAFVPAMAAKGWGRFIGINTECTMQSAPTQSAYIAGKAGMDRVLRVLAKEIGGKGVTVNQVAPGWMISDKDRTAGTEKQPGYEKSVPLGHRGEDQDVANCVVFLASDLAKFITGVYLPVCGGHVMPAI